MIKILQKKFIITAMIAVSILLVVLLGVINLVNAWAISQKSDKLLSVLSKNESEQAPMAPDMGKGNRGFFLPALTEDEKMSAVYFTVRFDHTNIIARVDVNHISSVTESQARDIASAVCDRDSSHGKTGTFKYTSSPTLDGRGTVYTFLDVSSDYKSILRILMLSLLTGGICWGLMLLLVILLSKKAIRPIAENMQKQRRFVTDAGHEIKTPLAIILANTEAMELHQGESKWSKNIREQVNRLTGLTQNLLTLAKADEDKPVLSSEHLSVTMVLVDTIRIFSEAMALKKLSLRKTVPSNSDIAIQADKEQISNLFSILLDNAVKYSVPESVVSISLTKEGKSATICFENTCEVLPSCRPEQLFDRFFRADAARTQKNGGCGIGLSAAKTIVEAYNGTIKASYLPENTITFIIRLPCL